MKTFIEKLNTPRIRTLLAAGLAAFLTWLITKFGLQLSEDQRAQIIIYSGLAVGWLFRDRAAVTATATATAATAGITAIQDALPGVASTGTARVNGTTVAAVEALVAASPNPLAVIRPAVATVNLTERK